uniref:DM13 domain-containing protein n=1 Tax=Gongylonema pulchrum TaxID=637853 RepID=A0A183D5J6_9BILA
LVKDYIGNSDLVVRLAHPQTVYDINYISVFCYEYAADFGHIYFSLPRDHIFVPPYIPPVRDEPPPAAPSVPC